MQILLQLKTAGLVASVRGASGGYQLAKPPQSISLAAVINAIDDRTLSARGDRGDLKLNRTPAVEALTSVWKEMQAVEQRLLENVTLAELIRRTQLTNALSYQI